MRESGVLAMCMVQIFIQVTSSRLVSEICSDGEDVIITVARDVLRHSDKIVRLELDMEGRQCQRLTLPLLSVPTGGRPVGPWWAFHFQVLGDTFD
jgi:hypothetical protein